MKRSKPTKLPTLGKIKYGVPVTPPMAGEKKTPVTSAVGKESFSEKPKAFKSALSPGFRKNPLF